MVQFTFDGLFRTISKGLPTTSSLDPYSYLSLSHFVYSLLIEIIVCAVICGFVGMSIYRTFYKIKNKKFFPVESPPEDYEKQSQKSKSQNDNDQGQNTADNLIYRFDEDDHEKQKVQDKQNENEESDEEPNDDQELVSQETTEWFLELDHKILYLQPFLIGFIVATNIFAVNVIVLLLLCAALVLFFLFNIKEYVNKYPILQCLFIIPCIATFLTVFTEDLHMST